MAKKKYEYILQADIDRSYYINGFPVQTEWGLLKPIKIKEYHKVAKFLAFLSKKDWVIKRDMKINVLRSKDDRFKNQLSDLDSKDMYTCIRMNVLGLRNGKIKVDDNKEIQIGFEGYEYILSLFFVEGEFDDTTITRIGSQENFEKLINIILEMNSFKRKTTSFKNAEDGKDKDHWDWLKSLWNSRGKNETNSTIQYKTMYTTIMKECGYKPHDINDLTLLQFFEEFKRIDAFKAHETTTLYKTVDSKDKINIVDWYRSTDEDESKDRVYNNLDEIRTKEKRI